MVKEKIGKFFLLVIILLIFKNWFIAPFLSARDWPYYFRETLADFSFFPPSWAPTFGIGLGGELVNYSLDSYIYFIVSFFVNSLGLPWEFVYKVLLFGLFLILSVFSSSYLLKQIVDRPNNLQILLAALLFTANTYILMVTDGGQVGIALAYSIAPLVLARFIKIIQNSEFRIQNSVLAGLVLAVQVMFDLRIAFVTMGIVLLYTIYHYLFIERFNLKLCTIRYTLTAFIVFGFHAYWLLPIVVFQSYPAQEILSSFSSVEGFRFLSFATFSQTISLLHPNWPENIFGKVYFMRPEFLILPILAYSSLLFVISNLKSQISNLQLKSQNLIIIFFALLGLLGAFLAKGANPPFGQINEWIFMHLPFSSLFRDSTKFYLLTILSYAFLIPYSLSSLINWAQFKTQKYLPSFLYLLAIFYLLFLINPVIFGQLKGTFGKHEIPKEYINLKDFLHSQSSFSRTLWIPTQQRYNYYSYMHPAVSADKLFSATNSGELVKKLSEEKASEFLSNLSIQYVIVPYDSFGEIFVEDRKYNEKEYLETIKLINNIAWLKRVSGFDKIAVYEVPNYKDHFRIDGEGSFSYKSRGPAEYQLEILTEKPTTLIFAEKYSPYWMASIDGKNVASKSTQDNANSFLLEKTGVYMVKVYFSKQQYYTYGRVITLVLLVIFLSLVILKKKNNL